jgi:hypothetical protein
MLSSWWNKISLALTLAHRAYIINNGHIAHEAPTSEIKARPQVLMGWCGRSLRRPCRYRPPDRPQHC